MLWKSMGWFLYDKDLRCEIVIRGIGTFFNDYFPSFTHSHFQMHVLYRCDATYREQMPL